MSPAGDSSASTAADRIQPGIYFRSGESAPPAYRLVLLNAADGATGTAVRTALERVTSMLEAASAGEVRELRGTHEAERRRIAASLAGLAALVAFGRRLFDAERHRPPLTCHPRPTSLVYLPADAEPFPAVRWASRRERGNPAQSDFALQLTGPTEAAVDRAAVEVWKLIADDGLPLAVTASYSGFVRTDGRGWLEFHDGVSNIKASHRLAALVAPADPEWMAAAPTWRSCASRSTWPPGGGSRVRSRSSSSGATS